MRNFIIVISFLITIGSTYSQPLYWEKILPNYQVYDLIYDGSEYLYFCSRDGNYNSRFLRSSDAGNSWETVGSGLNSNYLKKLAIDSTGNLWGVNDLSSFGVFKSSDKGLTWTKIVNGISANYIHISEDNNIYLGMDDGNVLFSTDGGLNWKERFLEPDSGDVISIVSISNNIFACTRGNFGFKAKIYRSSNHGDSWEHVYTSLHTTSFYFAIQPSTNILFGYGPHANIYSSDGGDTWIETDRSLTYVRNFYINSDTIFYVAAMAGLRSYDFENWDPIGPFYLDDPSAYTFIDSSIFAATNNGIFRYDPSVTPYIADSYFPLKIGNTWQHNSRCTKYNPIYRVDRDTVIFNNKYFRLEGYYNDWVRYDTTENKLFIWYNDSDYVAMDFSLNYNSYRNLLLLGSHQVRYSQIIEPYQLEIFGSLYHSRGFFWRRTDATAWDADEVSFSENLGETLSKYASAGPGGGYSCNRKMIRAILHDSSGVQYYSDKVKPNIYFTQDTITANLEIIWDFSVDHNYSYFSTNKNVNFIDTVYMVGYYSDGTNLTENDTIGAVNTPLSPDYSLEFSLDTTLIKNGYDFYYKIIATDAGIVPETRTKPDSGNYKLTYDPNFVSVDDAKANSYVFTLLQNYPNPFNPSTTISWQSPVSGNQTLKVYDVLGDEVATLVNEYKPAGSYEVKFNASELPSGVYFYRLSAGKYVETKKMIFLK